MLSAAQSLHRCESRRVLSPREVPAGRIPFDGKGQSRATFHPGGNREGVSACALRCQRVMWGSPPPQSKPQSTYQSERHFPLQTHLNLSFDSPRINDTVRTPESTSHVQVSRVISGAPLSERYLIAIWDSRTDPISDTHVPSFPVLPAPTRTELWTAAMQGADTTGCGPAKSLTENVAV